MKFSPNLKQHLSPLIVAAAIAASLPVVAQAYDDDDVAVRGDTRYDTARVVKVDAIVNHASRPVSRETCWQQPTSEYRPGYTYYRDDDDDGRPESVTVGGGYRTTGEVEHCRTRTDWSTTDRILGYEVTYRYGGRDYQTRMDHDPGDRIRVRVNYDYSIDPED